MVDEAVKAGARVRSGGGEPDGAVYQPTVLSSVNSSMPGLHDPPVRHPR
jgi:acyl-CoA reductase-like NAD-dependent aldehyde dehydrogenase